MHSQLTFKNIFWSAGKLIACNTKLFAELFGDLEIVVTLA
jgi:hypothetical protein